VNGAAALQLGAFLALLLVLVKPLGDWMAAVFEGRPPAFVRWFGPLERGLCRAAGIDPGLDMTWRQYAGAFLLVHAWGLLLLLVIQLAQHLLPGNPLGLGPVPWYLAVNTAVSFVTNTNWQSYGGETTLSDFSQTVGLTVQNFVSAAAGMAVLVALARGFQRNHAAGIGNFWSDLVRGTVYVLLPLSMVLALALVSQGVVQTVAGPVTVSAVAAGTDAPGLPEQTLVRGAVASQVAIKQLGTNGGGFYNVNSAHPFENPTPLSNLLELLAILVLPAALCWTFGRLVGDRRQGVALLVAMLLVFVPCVVLTVRAEQAGNPVVATLGVDDRAGPLQAGGNMEGKEVRFGVTQSALWAAATTAASNGSVNSMHDSFTPIGGLVPMWLMQLGEVVFGGVGSGLYGLLLFAIVTVFLAGLMIGRTPEYLGKKIEAPEMKMTALAILAPSLMVLVGTAVAVVSPQALAGIANPGPHGFSEVLYAFSSAANNNGSAFAGLGAGSTFYTLTLAIAMLVGRFGVALPVPGSAGTLPTHDALFVLLLVGVVLLVGALTFLPALALGPVVEQLLLTAS
jgi:K+-transporting ATPase ATPase A chain